MKNYRLVFRQTDLDKFQEIQNGTKTIETRAATKKYRTIKAGDTLTFACGDKTLIKTVKDVQHYSSLEKIFAALPMENILPGAKTLADAEKIYYSFPEYKEKLQTEGILAFSLS